MNAYSVREETRYAGVFYTVGNRHIFLFSENKGWRQWGAFIIQIGSVYI